MDIDSTATKLSSQPPEAFLPAMHDDGNTIPGSKKLEDPFSFERDRSRERKPGQRSESQSALIHSL